MKVDLSDLNLLSYSGNTQLSGSYSDADIIGVMVEKWIPYFECHKCGRWDCCQFTQKHPSNPNRSVEIKCGVAVRFINNIVALTFNKLNDLNKQQLQHYLNSLYFLTQYIQDAEQSIGLLTNKDQLDFWGQYSTSLLGATKNTLDILSSAHVAMKHVPFFNSKRCVIFVEGESEEIFCKTLTGIAVHNYSGAGNLAYSKIEYTIKEYIKEGYNVLIQLDLDGKLKNSNIEKIISRGLVPKENTFAFVFDFETSIPLELFHLFLVDEGLIPSSFNDFIKNYDGKSIEKHCKKKYNLEINKTKISKKLCDHIYKSSLSKNLFYDKAFLTAEIGKFWYFLQTKSLS